ncbi:MAG: hypothetical protein FWF82_03790 [Oscillospiraceae bacterium]|nr:hypothetical protein [Oscillospiraceae bacterium]
MKKRILSVIVIFAIAFSATPASAFTQNIDDGNPTISDALEIMKFLAGLPNEIKVEDGNKPTINDAIEVLKFLARLPSVYSFIGNVADIENMSDERLIEEVYKQNKFAVAGFFTPDSLGVDLIEKQYYDGKTLKTAKEHYNGTGLTSATSQKEAEQIMYDFLDKQNGTGKSVEYLGENDYYYMFRAEYTHEWDFSSKVMYIMRRVVFKEDALYRTFNNQVGSYNEIRALDGKSVLDLLDTMTFFRFIQWTSARVIHREFEETDSEYLYTYYAVSITYGDWGINNTAVLEKSCIGVDKKTGKITYHINSEYIKEVEIEGTAPRIDDLF